MRNLECKFKFKELKKKGSDFLEKNEAAVIKMFFWIFKIFKYPSHSIISAIKKILSAE
jgi:hypothetical protein